MKVIFYILLIILRFLGIYSSLVNIVNIFIVTLLILIALFSAFIFYKYRRKLKWLGDVFYKTMECLFDFSKEEINSWIVRQLENLRNWVKDFLLNWITFFSVIIIRFLIGLKHPRFIVYFLAITLGAGGLGVWLTIFSYISFDQLSFEAIKSHKHVVEINKSIATFFIALISASCADLILKKKPKRDAEILQILAVSLLLIGGMLFFLAFKNYEKSGFKYSVIGFLISIFLWWISNAIDKKYRINNTSSSNKSIIGGEMDQVKNLGNEPGKDSDFGDLKVE